MRCSLRPQNAGYIFSDPKILWAAFAAKLKHMFTHKEALVPFTCTDTYDSNHSSCIVVVHKQQCHDTFGKSECNPEWKFKISSSTVTCESDQTSMLIINRTCSARSQIFFSAALWPSWTLRLHKPVENDYEICIILLGRRWAERRHKRWLLRLRSWLDSCL